MLQRGSRAPTPGRSVRRPSILVAVKGRFSCEDSCEDHDIRKFFLWHQRHYFPVHTTRLMRVMCVLCCRVVCVTSWGVGNNILKIMPN